MEKKTKELLIIFYRNPVLGKVKTRLAATIENAKALEIYRRLVAHTQVITCELDVDKAVFYSDHVDVNDGWEDTLFQKLKQQGTTLGERMYEAFSIGFSNGYESIYLIGTDCLELSSSVINIAFIELRDHDAVIGPARDGGYYLMGINKIEAAIFQKKKWGTGTVYEDTISDFKRLALRYSRLPILSDIDVEDDLPTSIKKLITKP